MYTPFVGDYQMASLIGNKQFWLIPKELVIPKIHLYFTSYWVLRISIIPSLVFVISGIFLKLTHNSWFSRLLANLILSKSDFLPYAKLPPCPKQTILNLPFFLILAQGIISWSCLHISRNTLYIIIVVK